MSRMKQVRARELAQREHRMMRQDVVRWRYGLVYGSSRQKHVGVCAMIPAGGLKSEVISLT